MAFRRKIAIGEGRNRPFGRLATAKRRHIFAALLAGPVRPSDKAVTDLEEVSAARGRLSEAPCLRRNHVSVGPQGAR